jgi:hypothetical protein
MVRMVLPGFGSFTVKVSANERGVGGGCKFGPNSYSITLIRRLASSLRGISPMDRMLTNCLPGKTKIILDNMFAAQISSNSYIFSIHQNESNYN